LKRSRSSSSTLNGSLAALPRRRLFDFLRQGGAVGEPGQCVVMRQEGDALIDLPALGDVVDDDDEIFRFTCTVAQHDAAGRLNPHRAAFRRVDFLLREDDSVRSLDRFEIVTVDAFGIVVTEQFERGAAKQFGARHIVHHFEGAVDEDIFECFRVLHDHRYRDVLDDRVEKYLGLVQFPRRALLVGDVVMGRNPAAVLQRLAGDAHQPAIAVLVDAARFLGIEHRRQRHALVLGIAFDELALEAMRDDVAVERAGPGQVGRQIVHLGIDVVADDEPAVLVEHAQALRHVLDGGVQAHALLGEVPLPVQFSLGEDAGLVAVQNLRARGVELVLLLPRPRHEGRGDHDQHDHRRRNEAHGQSRLAPRRERGVFGLRHDHGQRIIGETVRSGDKRRLIGREHHTGNRRIRICQRTGNGSGRDRS
jgi:hypothetical protein